MNTYFMGEDVNKATTIIGRNTIPSEYQDLIDQYKARGGRITYCEEGKRTTTTPIPSYNVCKAEQEPTVDGTRTGNTVMDQASLNRYEANPTDPDAFFDNKDLNQ